MCKNKIEEAALSVEGVKSTKWSSTNEKQKLEFDPANNLEKILKNFWYGYDSEKFIAKDEVYENLHYCCKYDRKLKKNKFIFLDKRYNYLLILFDNYQ